MSKILYLLLPILIFTYACKNQSHAREIPPESGNAAHVLQIPQNEPPISKIPVTQTITVSAFFKYIDAIVGANDTLTAYHLTENLLLRANPWILDTLVHTDYYYQASLGHFIDDQTQMVILHPGDTLLIPGPKTAAVLLEKMARTSLDINIPAFELRILEGDSVLYRIPVRVGKKQKKYLELAGGNVDLRTRTGSGEIIRVNRDPLFIDPVTGKKFKFTKRDDHRTTLMPQIPWLEPEINGIRYGQMIHPTTNPRSLGKPASNGCIGTGEGDAWRVYFFAPLGTKVHIRYDLEVVNEKGDTIRYDDVYELRRKMDMAGMLAVTSEVIPKKPGVCLCDDLFITQ